MLKQIAIGVATGALIIGVSTVSNADLLGHYYNLDSLHPDMETAVTGVDPGYVLPTLTPGSTPDLTAKGLSIINQWDWWSPAYAAFSRLDSDSDLQSAFVGSWFPVNTGLSGDPQHFAVHWEGQFYVDSDKTYTYSMGSDDDSWLFIDNQLVLDLGGIHAMSYTNYDVNLTMGWHNIDIFFAERHVVQSGFQLNFFSDLVPDPVPEPGTLLLFGTGIIGLAGWRLRRKKK